MDFLDDVTVKFRKKGRRELQTCRSMYCLGPSIQLNLRFAQRRYNTITGLEGWKSFGKKYCNRLFVQVYVLVCVRTYLVQHMILCELPILV